MKLNAHIEVLSNYIAFVKGCLRNGKAGALSDKIDPEGIEHE